MLVKTRIVQGETYGGISTLASIHDLTELNVLAAHTDYAQHAYWIGGNANITGDVRRVKNAM